MFFELARLQRSFKKEDYHMAQRSQEKLNSFEKSYIKSNQDTTIRLKEY
jgi:hypothetical protein